MKKLTSNYEPRVYRGEQLNRVAFPLGGIGAGMVALEGTGALSHVSVRHKPEVFNEPCAFSAVCIRGRGGNTARVLEGPVPAWKVLFPWGKEFGSAGNGGPSKTYGLPRFAKATFEARFPFGTVSLSDPRLPLAVTLAGWSPFVPGDADASSLPVAALEFSFENRSRAAIEAVYSFNARNFMGLSKGASVRALPAGFALCEPGSEGKRWEQGAFAVTCREPRTTVNAAWFRGGWFDPLTMAWREVEQGELIARPAVTEGEASVGGSLYVPFRVAPGRRKTIRILLSWYVPHTALTLGRTPEEKAAETAAGAGACGCGGGGAAAGLPTHEPWYAGRFDSIDEVAAFWADNVQRLRRETLKFADCFHDTTLPAVVVDAVAANLTILKSPTVLRQKDGRLWAWEGCCDEAGCCHGSCTHVWNYAQALPHLFPGLERSLRRTEFNESQDERGHQNFRAFLPIRPADHGFHAAADGQLGGIMKVYREWRISGDGAWMRDLWPKVRSSLDYCIATWDPEHRGTLTEPHHNTYDIEFWGADGMCTSFYLGALKAAIAMGRELGADVAGYERLFEAGRTFAEKTLFNGEYFVQRVQTEGLRAKVGETQGMMLNYSPEAQAILTKEGPKYQYGAGCLADGVLGAWIAEMCGLGEILDRGLVRRHLESVFHHNFRKDLSGHANPQRPTYALGNEGGLLLCTWPKGDKLSLPFPYSDEVWTGIEYQVASHLVLLGRVREGLAIVEMARSRYDGRVRNPFNEYECGHWYARALSSYGLLQSFSGARYDAVDRTLHLRPALKGDFRAFLATATGYGTVGMQDGKPFLKVKAGRIPVDQWVVERSGPARV